MTTVIECSNSGMLIIQAGACVFVCGAWEFNRHHEGVWNSRVLAFVPQALEYNTATDNLRTNPYEIEPDAAYFSDGTPVSSYEQFN